jgi:hypothetical protein
MKSASISLFKFVSLVLTAAASVVAAQAHAGTRIDCRTNRGAHVAVEYRHGKVLAGYAYGDEAIHLGPTSARMDAGVYTYGFKIIRKYHNEHCGNEYFYDNLGDHLLVILDQAIETITGDSRYEKTTVKLNYNPAQPARSELKTTVAYADSILPFAHGAFEHADPMSSPVSCTQNQIEE